MNITKIDYLAHEMSKRGFTSPLTREDLSTILFASDVVKHNNLYFEVVFDKLVIEYVGIKTLDAHIDEQIEIYRKLFAKDNKKAKQKETV